VAIKSNELIKNARRSGLWQIEHIHKSAVTRARKKVPWKVFKDITKEAVKLAYECYPKNKKHLWHGMSVFAIDGSIYNLPATPEIRTFYDPTSGLGKQSKGHYPQCLVSTAYDVFRRLPVARTVAPNNTSERTEALKLLEDIPPDGLLVFDRGYPGYEFFHELSQKYSGHYLFRNRTRVTSLAISEFADGPKDEAIIMIGSSEKFRSKCTPEERKTIQPIKMRAIKYYNPQGELSILLTNLFDKVKFPKEELIKLYFKRWEVETYYRDEKVTMGGETFHSKSINGVLQELHAVVIMTLISRAMIQLSLNSSKKNDFEPQFKNAIITTAKEAAIFSADNPQRAIKVFRELLCDIDRIKYYRPKVKRKSQPRVSKQTINKWTLNRPKKRGKP
jgi:hypothetical protein